MKNLWRNKMLRNRLTRYGSCVSSMPAIAQRASRTPDFDDNDKRIQMTIRPRLGPPLLAIAVAILIHAQSALAADLTPPSELANWSCTGHCGSTAPVGDITGSPLGNPKHGYVSTAGSQAFGVSPLSVSDNKVGAETNGSKFVSGVFAAGHNDRLDVVFNYASTDGNGYDDYAWARLLDVDNNNALASWVFTARSTNSGSNNIVPGDVLPSNEFDARSVITNYRDYEFTAKTIDWAPLGVSNNICWESDAKGCGFTGWLQSSVTFEKAGRYRLEVGVVNWGDTLFDSGLAFDYAGLVDSRIAPVPEPRTYMMMLAGLMMLGLGARNRLRTRRGT